MAAVVRFLPRKEQFTSASKMAHEAWSRFECEAGRREGQRVTREDTQ